MLGRRVQQHRPSPQTLQDLHNVILEEWDHISQEEVTTLISNCKAYLQSIEDKPEIIPTKGAPDELPLFLSFAPDDGFGKIATAEGEFPHMALLGYGPPDKNDWQCGGSLISDQYILTSGFCTNHPNLGPPTTVRLGTTFRNDTTAPTFKVAEIIRHPEFKPPAAYNDIALLKLDKKVNFAKNVRPACLYTSDDLTGLKDLSATGWGTARLFESDPSNTLLKVYLGLFTHEECKKSYETVSKRTLALNILDKSQICAGGRYLSRDTCQGDGGGPLQVLDSDKVTYHIVGIVSFGRNCGYGPGVYTRVSNYVPWIESIVWQ